MKKFLLVAILFAFVIIFGCGNKTENTAGDKNDKTGDQIKTDDKKNDTTLKKDDASLDKQGASELGLTEGLPSNFPKELPQPKNSQCMGSVIETGGTTVTFLSTETPKQIFDFYKEQMLKIGYELPEGGDSLAKDKGGLIGWKKGNKEVGLMVAPDSTKRKSQIVLTYN